MPQNELSLEFIKSLLLLHQQQICLEGTWEDLGGEATVNSYPLLALSPFSSLLGMWC